MRMRYSKYHKVLRVSAVVCALGLLFQSGIVYESTKHLSMGAQQYIANAVGASASIDPTELNSLTAELTAQKLALQQRESKILDREIEIGLTPGAREIATSTYVFSGILFILLVLIVLNYGLDYMRLKEKRTTLVEQAV